MVEDTKADHDTIVVALSTLCNLILEFSPSKEHILEQGCVGHICSLTRSDNYDLKLNSVWALMNIAFQSDIAVKVVTFGDSVFESLSNTNYFPLIVVSLDNFLNVFNWYIVLLVIIIIETHLTLNLENKVM